MNNRTRSTKQYLLIESSPSLDCELLKTVLENDSVSVDIAQQKSAAVKLLDTNVYHCLITALPESQPLPFLKWIRSQQPTVPFIVLFTANHPDALNWAAVTDNVHPIWYEATSATETTDQIHRIIQDKEFTSHIDDQTTLREAIRDILSGLWSAETRDELEATICNQLIATDLYSGVGCATVDNESGTLELQTAIGIHSQTIVDQSMTERALESVTVESSDTGIREQTMVTVPLRHEATRHGILLLTTDRDVDTAEQDLLAALGEDIGAAIDAIDSKSNPQSTDFASLQTFSQILAHELRNHLQAVRSHLEYEVSNTPETDQILTVLDRIERLVHDATLITQETIPAEERTDVQLSEVLDRVRERNPEFDKRLTVLESKILSGQPQLLELLFENLFRNTVQHAGDDAEIRVGMLDDGFFVEDTGDGFPSTVRDSLFEWDESTNSSGGDGLAIVRRIIDAHNWEITATESAEDGARFEITEIDSGHQTTGKQVTH